VRNVSRVTLAAATAIMAACFTLPALAQAPSEADMQRGKAFMQKSMAMMTPELLEKAKALPPEIQQFLLKVAIKHKLHSDTLTLTQVMQEFSRTTWQSVRQSPATTAKWPPMRPAASRTTGYRAGECSPTCPWTR
jgi:hypothetical protein